MALAAGKIEDVDGWLSRIPLPVFQEWKTYAQTDQLLQDKIDYWGSYITCILANAHRDQKKRRRPWAPKDFLPHASRPRRRQTGMEMKAIAFTMAEAHNRSLKKRGGK